MKTDSKKDKSTTNIAELSVDGEAEPVDRLLEDDQWDEWYDDCYYENKVSKIRRSIKRNYNRQNDW